METFLSEELVKVICIKTHYKNNLLLSLTEDDITIIDDDSLNDMVLSHYSYENDEFLQSWLHGERWSEVIKFTSEKKGLPGIYGRGKLVMLNIGKIKKDLEAKVVKNFTVFLWITERCELILRADEKDFSDLKHQLKTYLKYDQYLLN